MVGSTPAPGGAFVPVLCVDDDEATREIVAQGLTLDGYAVSTAGTLAEARDALHARGGRATVVLDLGLPDGDGLTLLSEIRRRWSETPVIVSTGRACVATAVRAIQDGAFHYFVKPVDLRELSSVVERAQEAAAARWSSPSTRGLAAAQVTVIGESPEMVRVKDLVARFARSPASTVLVTGESGTGKDVVARALHAQSDRAAGPFTNITCSAMPETLLESELFGHEKGSFTGAHVQKRGLFELSHGGTLFLDEIGEMSPVLQAKLLRLLESKTFRRVGGTRDLTPDVRVVAATNRDLREEVRAGRFREDLYYRLAVLHVHLPPLRQRRQDIPVLVSHFLSRFEQEFGRRLRGVAPRTSARLTEHPWPGNVRELRNAVERAVLLAPDGSTLTDADFQPLMVAGDTAAADADASALVFTLPAQGVDLATLERSLVQQALRRTHGNRTRAGRLLGLNRDQVRYRLAKIESAAGPDDSDPPDMRALRRDV